MASSSGTALWTLSTAPESPRGLEVAMRDVEVDILARLEGVRGSVEQLLAQQALQNVHLQQLSARQEQQQRKHGAHGTDALMATLQRIEGRFDRLQRSVEERPAGDFAADFAGLWYENKAKHVIAGSVLYANGGDSKAELQLHGRRDFCVVGAGDRLGRARLSDDGQQLVWNNGQIWTRAPAVSPRMQKSSSICEEQLGQGRRDSRSSLSPISDVRVRSKDITGTPRSVRGPSKEQATSPKTGRKRRDTTISNATVEKVVLTWLEKQNQRKSIDGNTVKSSASCADVLRDRASSAGSFKKLFWKAADIADWVEVQQADPEPRARCIDRFMHSYTFELMSATLILANAAYIGYSAEWFMQHPLEPPTKFMSILDLSFFILFSIELFLRLVSAGLTKFMFGPDAKWYMLDVILLGISAADLATDGGAGGYSWLRALRVFKLARVIRMIRTVRLFRNLRLLMDSVVGSLVSLVWCLLVIGFLFYLFGVIFVQGLADVMGDLERDRLNGLPGGSPPQERLLTASNSGRQFTNLDEIGRPGELMDYILFRYGSVSKAVLRLWTSTTGGVDWEQEYNVISLCGVTHSVVFIGFIALMMIVVWNIVTSTIMERALRFAKPDIDQLIVDKRRKDNDDVQLLVDMFNKAGIDLTQKIEKDEFLKLLEQPDLADFLQAHGIDIKEAHTFLALIGETASPEGVDIMSFITSCLRVKGFATSIDLHTAHQEVMHILQHQAKVLKHIGRKVLEQGATPRRQESPMPEDDELQRLAFNIPAVPEGGSSIDLLNDEYIDSSPTSI